MPKKISKSDTLDKDQEARERAWLSQRKESQHFAVGTFVLYSGKRYEVIGRLGDTLTIVDDFGSAQFIRPMALRRK